MEAAWIGGLCAIVAAVIGGMYLLKVKRTPEAKPLPEDVTLAQAWDRLDKQAERIDKQTEQIDGLMADRDKLMADRDTQRHVTRVLGDGFDALRAAMARILPPPTFTRWEQDAIDRAAAIRDEDIGDTQPTRPTRRTDT